MTASQFPKFKQELLTHDVFGYHRSDGPMAIEDVEAFFKHHGWTPTPAYLDFLCEIGPGRYFGNALHIFPLSGKGASVEEWTEEIESFRNMGFLCVAYDGNRSGFFCLFKTGREEVYWFRWDETGAQKESETFVDWIESLPEQMHSESVYAEYTPVNSPSGIQRVCEQRKQIEVEIIGFKQKLERPPGRENDSMARYNRISFRVLKRIDVDIDVLTVKVLRTGSAVGQDNISYATLDISKVPVGRPTRVEGFAFNHFPLPFQNIVCLYQPEISLARTVRTNYAEIEPYL